METGGLPRTFGDFRFEREAGRGAMGVVYEAEQLSTGRHCAVKLLAAHVHADDEAVERFRREGQLAGSIAHPRTVFVYAADEVDGTPFIAMEWMPGGTLKDVVERGGPLPVSRAVDCTLHVLDGLVAAADAGVVHRDVKPSNCFLDTDGSVKVGDFGLAKSLRAGFDLTLTGEFIGTPYFASPEQVRGRELDPRSDQYSLAATLFYLLSGRPLFPGTHAGDVLGAIVSDKPPRLRALRHDVPAGLERVLRRALSKNAEDRYPDFESFRRALLPYSTQALAPAARGPRFLAWLVDIGLIAMASDMLGMAAALLGAPGLREWPLRAAATLAYFVLFEGLLGRTPGKALLGLAVGRRPRAGGGDSPVPSLGAALQRTGVYLLCMLLGGLIPTLHIGAGASSVEWISRVRWEEADGLSLLGLLLLACTMRRSNGWSGVHERLSRTFVYHRASEERPARRRAGLQALLPCTPDPELPAQLGSFEIRGVLARSGAGADALLLGRDPSLGRAAWIVLRAPAAPPLSPTRRDLRRGLRLRWLGAGHGVSGRWDAFEAPGGGPLSAVIPHDGPLPWTEARHLVFALAEELRAAAQDGTLPERLSLEHVWLTPNGRLRLLDVVPGVGGDAPAAAAQPGERELLVFVADVAVALVAPVTRRGRDSGAPEPHRLPLPRHAADTLISLREDARQGFDEALERLGKLTRRTASVTRAMRIIEALPAALLLLLSLGLGGLTLAASSRDPVQLAALALNETPVAIGKAPARDAAVQELLAAARVVLAGSDQEALSAAGVLDGRVRGRRGLQLPGDTVRWSAERAASELASARAAVGSPSAKALERAGALLERWEQRRLRTIGTALLAVVLPLIMLLGALVAFLLRGSLLLNFIRVEVHTRERGLAGRWRCAWRAMALWVLPLGLVLASLGEVYLAAGLRHVSADVQALQLDLAPRAAFVPADVLLALAALTLLLSLVLPVWRPRRSVQDTLARTQLLPR